MDIFYAFCIFIIVMHLQLWHTIVAFGIYLIVLKLVLSKILYNIHLYSWDKKKHVITGLIIYILEVIL